jgi:HK97 family phage prohead protease
VASKIEQRIFSGVAIRAAADFTLTGIAAPYNTWSSDLGGFREQIRPGAFARALREKQDTKCLFNHDPNYVYGRVKNGTLTLRDTDAGLGFTCQLDKKNSRHQDLYSSVQRGDVDACSFAFQLDPGGDEWNGARNQRTLIDIAKLYDVSAVCNPAYPQGTTVAARSAQYVASTDWRSKHMAALAKLAPVIAADKAALAADYISPARQQYLDMLAETRAEGWDV